MILAKFATAKYLKEEIFSELQSEIKAILKLGALEPTESYQPANPIKLSLRFSSPKQPDTASSHCLTNLEINSV